MRFLHKLDRQNFDTSTLPLLSMPHTAFQMHSISKLFTILPSFCFVSPYSTVIHSTRQKFKILLPLQVNHNEEVNRRIKSNKYDKIINVDIKIGKKVTVLNHKNFLSLHKVREMQEYGIKQKKKFHFLIVCAQVLVHLSRDLFLKREKN